MKICVFGAGADGGFMAANTAVAPGASKAAMSAAAAGCACALSVTITRSCWGSVRGASVAACGRTVKLSCAVRSVRPRVRIASRCAPRATSDTS